ncbi:MAG: hypothetical protein A2600_11990 [Candidatus Lambdaproteobacteria bacterium RIFOXYD1_FULL_56_27]|uniref:ApeI dehydratase-like domain-containing protein n=1 Tax=Candidatus Lambdaproteobacteria bacterium RIFOXYD2_FULL_56_26 TaxID=1817773 RepID=A0A1F6GXE2_9PROT|nr:MAG: hypothetical protein A2426_08855 [Candidatus Lambdaproteobacteria bacterium RIFOXYC1_FULL_56_13]OGH02711.1 MAG: hypothetical protein A2557_11555 [Candidatus Lambdaproteobacteria bacterium RIFOXYD2_FULL_56_26]OGH07968.1 MAG: hypothetical protein A2600_11990 [Candidatus Lambdaproteobacteria bacterium RIFOXYD1_FULL_56_27]
MTWLDKEQIKQLIPHREPILFLDCAEIIEKYHSRGFYCWQKEHPVFEGHFPQFHLVPGIYLVEASAQLAAVTLRQQFEALPQEQADSYLKGHQTEEVLGLLGGIRKTLIHRPVFADNLVEFEVKMIPYGNQAIRANAVATVDGIKAATVELILGLALKTDLLTHLKQAEIP